MLADSIHRIMEVGMKLFGQSMPRKHLIQVPSSFWAAISEEL